MEIPGIKISQAKALFECGYTDIKSVACADCNIVQRVIQNALPFYDDDVVRILNNFLKTKMG